MRRRTALVALAGLAVVVSVGAVVLWPRENRITRQNYDRIRRGMNDAEVRAILGSPGDYSTGPIENDSRWVGNTLEQWSDAQDYTGDGQDGAETLGWTTDTDQIILGMDESAGVTDKMYARQRKIEQSPLENLLWRAKRQWHRWFPE